MAHEDTIALWSGDVAAWRAVAAPGSHAALASEGGALRFEFALAGHGAWAIARRELAFDLPAAYVVALQVRGRAQPVQLQMKLVDPGGANVWWWRRAAFTPSDHSERLVLRRASL